MFSGCGGLYQLFTCFGLILSLYCFGPEEKDGERQSEVSTHNQRKEKASKEPKVELFLDKLLISRRHVSMILAVLSLIPAAQW